MNHTAIRRWDIARAEAPVTETFDQFLWQGEQHLGDGSVLVGNMLRRTLSGVNSARASFVKKGCLYFLYPVNNTFVWVRVVRGVEGRLRELYPQNLSWVRV